MGFKRTAEGRVFFQKTGTGGAHDGANDTMTPDISSAPRPQQNNNPQIEVLSLLRTLNEHLKETQRERDQIRKQLSAQRLLVTQLEERAGESEKAYRDLQRSLAESRVGSASETMEEKAQKAARELEDTKKALGLVKDEVLRAQSLGKDLQKKQAALENIQKEQQRNFAIHTDGYKQMARRLKVTEERQETLDEKLEETTNQQAKLLRKVDKAVQDRTRFLRKMDRIEEIVLQTQDALTAKAMVLLTDQSASAGGENPKAIPAFSGLKEQDEQDQGFDDTFAEKPFWKKLSRLHGIVLAVFILAGVVSGWFISYMQISGNFVSGERVSEEALLQQKPFGEIRNPDEVPGVDDGLYESRETDAGNGENSLSQMKVQPVSQQQSVGDLLSEADKETPQTLPEEKEEARETEKSEEQISLDQEKPEIHNDIGAIDLENEAQLLAALDENPKELARQLNAIEPSIAKVAPSPATGIIPAPVTPVSLPPEDKAKAALPKRNRPEKGISSKTTEAELRARIKPDATLPPAVKRLEQKAFAGEAEAQHDLAAIYTAGHADVKQSYEKAALWFREAARQGVANAAYNLGVLYHQGLGVPESLEEAINWYDIAAGFEHPEAQYNLGIAYIEGIGVAYDPLKAASYFESSARSGLTEAAYNLGLIYENGLLGEAKPEEALLWYQTAAQKGSPEAKAALEQLAKSLNISLREVNRLVETMKETKGRNADPLSGEQKAEEDFSATPASEKKEASLPARRLLTMQVQEHLTKVGIYDGPIDGLNGPLTQDAIRSYQAMNNIRIDGNVSEDLLADLLMQNIPFGNSASN